MKKKHGFMLVAVLLISILYFTVNDTQLDKKRAYIYETIENNEIGNMLVISKIPLPFESNNFHIKKSDNAYSFWDIWENKESDDENRRLGFSATLWIDKTMYIPGELSPEESTVFVKGIPADYSSFIIFHEDISKYSKIEQIYFRKDRISYHIHLNSTANHISDFDDNESLLTLMENSLVKVNN